MVLSCAEASRQPAAQRETNRIVWVIRVAVKKDHPPLSTTISLGESDERAARIYPVLSLLGGSAGGIRSATKRSVQGGQFSPRTRFPSGPADRKARLGGDWSSRVPHGIREHPTRHGRPLPSEWSLRLTIQFPDQKQHPGQKPRTSIIFLVP